MERFTFADEPFNVVECSVCQVPGPWGIFNYQFLCYSIQASVKTKNLIAKRLRPVALVHQCREGMLLSAQALLPQTAECLPGGVVGLHLHPRPV